MEILTFISNLMIPLVIMYIVAYGLLAKTDIFDAFLKGATDGLKIVFRILPTLVGLMVAICILRESGFFNVLSVKATCRSDRFSCCRVAVINY